MALKRLTTGEMVSLSGPWVDPDHDDRTTLTAIPVLASLLPQIDGSHQGLLEAQPKAATPERVIAIQKEQRSLDGRHDDLCRGAYYLPMALAYLTKDKSLAEALIVLQSVLLPEGLALTQKSYREEAGQAKLLESRLAPEHITLLKKLKTLDGTLWDAVREWISVAGQLGALEDERTGAMDDGSSGGDGVKARNRWIRTVNAMRTLLALVEEEHPGAHAILRRIEEAERKADRRGAGGGEEAPAGEAKGGPVDEPPPPS
jgi:hypothetical protein